MFHLDRLQHKYNIELDINKETFTFNFESITTIDPPFPNLKRLQIYVSGDSWEMFLISSRKCMF